MIPLFKSTGSIGKSILTLDAIKDCHEGGSDSIFKIAIDNGLKSIYLIEDTCISFFEALNRAKELKIKLTIGLRLTVKNSLTDKDGPGSKVIVISKNDGGCKLINKIYTRAFRDSDGFIDWAGLKELWDNSKVKLALPFYDSFIYQNNFTFASEVPDLTFAPPTFFVEENSVSFDAILKQKVEKFALDGGFPTLKVKSIYYKDKKDVEAFQTYKITCGRTAGKPRTLEKPETPHFSSDEFCFESWKEQNK